MQPFESVNRSSVYALLTFLVLATPVSADVLINAGGSATGSYRADQYFSGGSAYTFGNQAGVYNTERWSSTAFSYAIPVAPGQVQVVLRFRESCATCGTRSFRVDAEGQTLLSNHVVPVNTVGDRTFTVTSDGTLNLVFTRVVGEAWVNGIEVRPVGSSGPPQLTLSANPASISVGNSSTLTWSSVGASTCTASGAWSGTRATSGSQSTGPLSATSSFALSCTGSGGTTSLSTTVAVVPNPPPSVTLTATPTTVASGAAATLNWSSANATSCTASGGWTGTRTTSGSASTGSLIAPTMFILTCTGSGGSYSRSVTVGVTAMPTLQLTASPSSVPGGGSATLSWTSTNATTCAAADAWSGTRPTSGSQSTGPLSATKTFALTCSGNGGTVTAFSTVSVNQTPAPSITLTATPSSVASGASSNLSWTSTNATTCSASGSWSGSKATSGSQSTGPLTAAKTFSLTCTGAGGSANASATVNVTGTFPALLINAGGGATAGYVADQYFTGGLTYTYGNQTGVYNTERWSSTSFSYAIPVSPGQVEVVLRFRESCSSCGTRSFRVDAEGQTLLANHVVPVNTVADRTFIVTSDSTLNLLFTRVAGEAWVNAIEVRPIGSGGAPQLIFSATPPSVSVGSASTLTWSTVGASTCTASGAWSGTRAASGSYSTGALSATSTFGLSCTGSGGTATGSALVTVMPNPPPSVTLTATPTIVASGAAATLSWSSANATSCSASGGWTGTRATSGSASTGAVTTQTTFSLTCSGAGGSTTTSASVNISGASSSIFPLHVEAGKRYLVDANGSPFLIHGDTPWSLIVQLSKADVDLYLENRRQKGFNTILVNLIEHYFATNPPKNFYGDAPFLVPGDFSTPNPAYFAHAEYVIAKAAQKGILVMLTPSYMGSGVQGWYQEMQANGATKLRAYGQYLANRFSAHDNILWVHGGDMNPPDKNLLRAIAEGIRSVDGRWLHTFHGSRGTSALAFLGTSEPWLQVNTIYTDQSTVVMRAETEYARSTMPFFLIEAAYEAGSSGLGNLVRQQAYQAVLSGANGQFMGHNSVWAMLDNTWRSGMDSEGAQTLTHLRTLLESLSWWGWVPDINNALLTGGIGTGAGQAVASLASDRSVAVIYSPSVRTLTVNLSQLAGPRVTARWYDPTTGAYISIGSPISGGGSRTFAPSGNNARGSGDWVLVLQSVP